MAKDYRTDAIHRVST